jgi:ribosomal protein S12 methylthiotransferase accessory factor
MDVGQPKWIDIDSIHHEDCAEMLDMCANAGVGTWVYEMTSNIGVPVFMTIMVDRQVNIGMFKGYGCHLNSHIAMRRSICEAAQSRAVFVSGARDDLTQARQKELHRFAKSQNWEAMLGKEKKCEYREMATDATDSEAIAIVENQLVSNGCGRVLVVELLNRPNLAVVRVLVSGLCGYWNGHLERGKRAS